jgi:hypothetical protein
MSIRLFANTSGIGFGCLRVAVCLAFTLLVGCKNVSDNSEAPRCEATAEELCCCDGRYLSDPVCDEDTEEWVCEPDSRLGICAGIEQICVFVSSTPCGQSPDRCCCEAGALSHPVCGADAGLWQCERGETVSCDGGATCFPWM